MWETLATCLFLQGLLLCFVAAVPYLSFIPAPVPPFVPTSALTAARYPLPTDDIPQPPGPPWLLRRYSISPEHRARQPSILLQGQHHVLWEMAQGAVEDVEMILIS